MAEKIAAGFLAKKWHGLPVWALAGGAGVLGVVGLRYYQSRKAAAAAGTGSTTSTAGLPAGATSADPGTGSLGGVPYGIGTSPNTAVTTPPGSNGQWSLIPNPGDASNIFNQGGTVDWFTNDNGYVPISAIGSPKPTDAVGDGLYTTEPWLSTLASQPNSTTAINGSPASPASGDTTSTPAATAPTQLSIPDPVPAGTSAGTYNLIPDVPTALNDLAQKVPVFWNTQTGYQQVGYAGQPAPAGTIGSGLYTKN